MLVSLSKCYEQLCLRMFAKLLRVRVQVYFIVVVFLV